MADTSKKGVSPAVTYSDADSGSNPAYINPEHLTLLLVQAKSGSQHIEELCEYLHKHVYVQAHKILKDDAAAEECTQEVLMRLCQNFSKIRNQQAAIAWIGTAIRNCAYDILRKQNNGAERNTSLDDLELSAEQFADNGHSVEEGVLRQEERRQVAYAIGELPKKEAQIIILHHFHDQPLTEIARTLGITETAASTRLYRARKRLKKTLTPTLQILIPGFNVLETPLLPNQSSNSSGSEPASKLGTSTSGTAKALTPVQWVAVAVVAPAVITAGALGITAIFSDSSQDVALSEITEKSTTNEKIITDEADNKDESDSDENSRTRRLGNQEGDESPSQTTGDNARFSAYSNTYTWTNTSVIDTDTPDDAPTAPEEPPVITVPPPAIPSTPGELPTEAAHESNIALITLLGAETVTTLENWASGREPLDAAQFQALLITHNFVQLQSGATTLYAYQRFTTGIYLSTQGGELRLAAHTGQVQPLIQEILAKLW